MSKTIILIHAVFGTSHRQSTLNPENKDDLHRMMGYYLTQLDTQLLCINSMPDHVHILMSIKGSISLSDVIGKLKAYTSQWMKRSGWFPLFNGWCDGYFACSVSPQNSEQVAGYIFNQEIHHNTRSYRDEMSSLYLKAGLQWHEKELD